MAEIVNMPKMTDTMEEGVLASWLVKEGEEVKVGDILAEVETDKATMELESYFDGFILAIQVEAGETAKVNQPLCYIGKKGEKVDLKSLPVSDPETSPEKESESKVEVTVAENKEAQIAIADIPAKVVPMPLMSDTMKEGVIANWLKEVGEKVESGDAIAEVETDKATMELEAYEDGTLLYQAVKTGEAVAVNAIVAIVGKPGTDFKPLLTQIPPEVEIIKRPEKDFIPHIEEVSTEPSEEEGQKHNGRAFATPLARKLSKDKGIDILHITGSGPNGRITKADVEAYKGENLKISAPIAPSIVGQENFRDEPVSQMRKTIAQRLSDSKFTSPHFYLTMAINMDRAIEARTIINAKEEGKISFNDLIIKAAALALRKHPNVNSSWLEDKIRYYDHIHVGVAVAVDEGLLVPVVRFADSKSLHAIAFEVKELAQKAKDKKLQPSEWEGNTFTISNLGMFGIEEFTAIINPPDACILAIGGINDIPKLIEGQLVNTHVMKVTLSCDHRVVDGATGAAFLNTLKEFLENPVLMLA
jgi:pyruvate dehydrogenase E2 component (dihydrolipoyllysine-residue acetyltransferase)